MVWPLLLLLMRPAVIVSAKAVGVHRKFGGSSLVYVLHRRAPLACLSTFFFSQSSLLFPPLRRCYKSLTIAGAVTFTSSVQSSSSAFHTGVWAQVERKEASVEENAAAGQKSSAGHYFRWRTAERQRHRQHSNGLQVNQMRWCIPPEAAAATQNC